MKKEIASAQSIFAAVLAHLAHYDHVNSKAIIAALASGLCLDCEIEIDKGERLRIVLTMTEQRPA